MNPLTRRRAMQAAALAVVSPCAANIGFAEESAKPAAPAFKLGLVTYMVGSKWDLPTLIDVCRKTNIAAVELRTTHAHGVEPALSADERKKVREQFQAAGVALWGLGSVCEFHSPDGGVVEQNIETCRQFVQLAADVGAKGVKVRPNGFPADVPREKTIKQIGQALAKCGEAAEAAGVEIWVEVHGHGTSEPAVVRDIMEACGHRAVGLTWNSNATDVLNGSIEDSFKLLRPWIRSCHINDLWKEASGEYPYRLLFRLLHESGYDRYTLCEVGKTPADVAAGEEFLRYYHALWSELSRPRAISR